MQDLKFQFNKCTCGAAVYVSTFFKKTITFTGV